MTRTLLGRVLLAASLPAPFAIAAESDAIGTAVSDPTRTEGDRGRDERDHTVAVLEFSSSPPA